MFVTKNYIELTNCRGSIVYSSKNGFSKIKDFERAYRQSIRTAFTSIQNLDSVYNSSMLASIQINNKDQVKKDIANQIAQAPKNFNELKNGLDSLQKLKSNTTTTD